MKPILTVSEITQVIKNTIEENDILRRVYIRGEISNFKHHGSGHMYFTLKDDQSQIRSVMFKSRSTLLPFTPENGMKVIAMGSVSVYPRNGDYQFYAEDIEPDGIGALHIAFEKLKQKLENEGLFDENKKLALPFLPHKIGIATSITGAALHDLLTVIKRRFQNVDIVIAPVLVQGSGAPDAICSAISDLNSLRDLDVIIVGRGGGSIEELWAFNDERVARAIFQSETPVISAVGHETDFTIADFVSDKRAPTPSAAGEMVVPEKAFLISRVMKTQYSMINGMVNFIALRRQRLEYAKKSSAFTRPYAITAELRVSIDQNIECISKEIKRLVDGRRSQLKGNVSKLNALSPLEVLARGYSIAVGAKDGHIIRKLGDVEKNDQINIILDDGIINCTVTGFEGKTMGNG